METPLAKAIGFIPRKRRKWDNALYACGIHSCCSQIAICLHYKHP